MLTKQTAAVKGFVQRNQTKILITTTVVATSAALLMKASLNTHDEFLRDHDLYDEYYTPDMND